MASGMRLFGEGGHHHHHNNHNNNMRMSYPATTFPAEFMFRNTATHPFAHVQFIPERIVEFSVTTEGLRLYKVQWQETWVPEHQLLQYQNIMEVFWQKQNELSVSCNNNNNNNRSSSKSLTLPSTNLHHHQQNEQQQQQQQQHQQQQQQQQQPSTSRQQNDEMQNRENYLSALMSNTDNTTTNNNNNNTTSTELVPPVVTATTPILDAKVIKKDYIKKLEALNDNTDGTTVTVRCDGFNIVNVRNNAASEDDIRVEAREVLSSFKKKRCPRNGTSNLPHTCFFCTKVLANRKALRLHQFNVHLKNVGEFPCPVCQQRFAFDKSLKKHMIVHTDARAFHCELCGLTYKELRHLQKHMKQHREERNYRCDVCNKTFKVQADLKAHCFGDHKDQENKCNVCKQKLHTAHSVYTHSMRHSGTRDYACVDCGISFKSRSHLVNHQKMHQRVECPATGCDKKFSTPVICRRHVELMHKDIAETFKYDFICTICEKDFAYKGFLEKHMRRCANAGTEDGPSPKKKKKQLKAEAMSEEELAKYEEKMERITNPDTGEVKLKCKLCRNAEFRFVTSMERHLDKHASGAIEEATIGGDFTCTVCDKVLKSEARLERHKRLHDTGKKIQKIKRKRGRKPKQVKPTEIKIKGAGKRKAALAAKSRVFIQTEVILEENVDIEKGKNVVKKQKMESEDEYIPDVEDEEYVPEVDVEDDEYMPDVEDEEFISHVEDDECTEEEVEAKEISEVEDKELIEEVEDEIEVAPEVQDLEVEHLEVDDLEVEEATKLKKENSDE